MTDRDGQAPDPLAQWEAATALLVARTDDVRLLLEAGDALAAALTEAREASTHSKYVEVANEIVAQLTAKPSRPVTVAIVKEANGRLQMTVTSADHWQVHADRAEARIRDLEAAARNVIPRACYHLSPEGWAECPKCALRALLAGEPGRDGG